MAELSGSRALAGRRLAARAAIVATVLAYSWWATTFRSFTWQMRITTALPGVVLLAAAARDHRKRITLRAWLSEWRTVLGDSHPSLPVRSKVAWRAGTVVWSLLIAAISGWELMARLNSPRPQYPTISSMAGALTQSHAVRFLVFVLWLLLGRDLLRR
ncbi:MAG TPA: hypothetical protein VE776_14925 [Actinomycetota bacterium]|jgi:hypothetical protein|nr:hypothetical protein [Actinomycetota bacterium]